MKKIALVIFFVTIFTMCSQENKGITIRVKNPGIFSRESQVVSISWDKISKNAPWLEANAVEVSLLGEGSEDKIMVHQVIDLNKDGQIDELIFQSDFEPEEQKIFSIRETVPNQTFIAKVFARFVPERMDDFAWENDRVAFRMYGPALQATGEISSGIDVWSKRTTNLIIDKWYSPDYENYHEDLGEGGDFYKVGPSRGCGGIAIWDGKDMYVSQNFVSYDVIANGPIRAIFELTYASWEAEGKSISEVKRISLDAGSNLNKIESIFSSQDISEPFECALGIVKRSTPSEVHSDMESGILRYWQQNEDDYGNTGCGIIVNPQIINSIVETKDHHLIIVKADIEKPVIYYAGACWDKSTGFENVKNWDDYLDNFVKKQQAPLEISF